MDQRDHLPHRDFSFLSLNVTDWTGPIVEIRFARPVQTAHDVQTVIREATTFMQSVVRPRARRAYFMTCYDGLSVGHDVLSELRERFVEFNKRFSLGDVRYGGKAFAKTLVVATSLLSSTPSNHFATRQEALASLRRSARDRGA